MPERFANDSLWLSNKKEVQYQMNQNRHFSRTRRRTVCQYIKKKKCSDAKSPFASKHFLRK
jgi:hypothetical protein